MANLMIVESPTKAAKMRQILGAGWTVEASVGHIADLPNGKMAIEPGSYKLDYELSDRGKSVIGKLKGIAASADEVYLATDPDREGEAISAHLRHYLRLSHYKRVTFNEITESGVRGALSSRRQIDRHLVDAQEARLRLVLIWWRNHRAIRRNTGSTSPRTTQGAKAIRIVPATIIPAPSVRCTAARSPRMATPRMTPNTSATSRSGPT